MAKKNHKKEVLKLVESGDYNIVQQINGGPEEPYEGCEHNLFMILGDSEPKVTLLAPSDPQARPNCKTYRVDYETFMGHCVVIIWER